MVRKKFISALLFIFVITASLFFYNINVKADSDAAPPVFNNISVDKKSVTNADNVTVTIDAGDDLSGVKSIDVFYDSPSGNEGKLVSLTKNAASADVYTGIMAIGQNDAVGIWKVSHITLTDNASNSINVYNSSVFTSAENGILLDLSNGNFEVNMQSINYSTDCIYNGVNYSSVFNADYYLNRYADLRAAYGSDSSKALRHFVISGMKEGRQALSSFDVYAYRANYLDLQKAYGSNLKSYYLHYVNHALSPLSIKKRIQGTGSDKSFTI